MVRSVARAALLIGVTASLVVATSEPATAADTSPPSEPGIVTVSSVTSTGAALKWGASTDNVAIEGYRVYRGPASAADSALSLIATTDAVTSYVAAQLRSGFAYKFGIVAIDAGNNKSVMRIATLTTLTSSDTTVPVAPSASSVIVTPFSDTRIDVVWGPSTSTDVAYYQVYRGGVLVGTVERPNSQRFSDNGLAPATTYSYTVRAVDSAGNPSALTAAKSAKTLATGAVKIARGPYLSNVTGTTALISWWTNIATSGSVTINGQTIADGVTMHHTVSVAGLAPGAAYPYTVTSGGVSGSGTLKTAATPGATFSFAAIGDFGGQSTGESQNATNIGNAGTSFIQTLGDNVYPSAGLPDPNFATTYSDFDGRFFKQFGSVVRSQAFFPANGNKEYYGDGEFWTAFPMPGSNHSWYSYDWGNAHILVLDSEQPFATGTEQYNFAQADLAANQGATWRIVAIQRPPYSSTTANSSSTSVKQYLVPMFQTQNVNLVLSGNSHNYERTFPLTNGAPATSGITYVVSGAGGNGFNAFTGTAPAYSAFRESSYYEYAKVTVSPTALTVDAIRADTNAVFDSTTITPAGGGDTTAPSAPTGLAAGTPTSTTVPLSWTANPASDGVTSYNVYRGGTKIGSSPSTSYTDSGLTPSTTYSYTVTAVDAAGNESGPSSAAAATTPAGGGTTVPKLVQAAAGTTATSSTATFGTGTAAGDVMVLTASLYTGSTNHITSVTDSAGSTWKPIGAYAFSGHNSEGEMWYAVSAGGVSAVTIHTAASSAAFQVQEFSGLSAAPLDVSSGTSNTSTTPSVGPISASSGELLVGFVGGHGSSQAISLASSYASTQAQTSSSGTGIVSVATGYAVQATTGSATLTATVPAAMYWAAGVAAFQAG